MAHASQHRFLSILLWLVGIVVVLALVAAGLVAWTVQRSFPTVEGSLQIDGLEHEATVTRDENGIPDITAETPHDLFLAQGYVQAQDRFWEMDFRRHVTSGRLSELFGESQVDTDTFIRTLGWREVAEKEVEKLDDESLSYYQAYADGVNDYIGNRTGADASLEYAVLAFQNPGYEPEPWTPADSVAWLKAMAWDLRSNLEQEIDRTLLRDTLSDSQIDALYPGYPYDKNPTITSDASAQALEARPLTPRADAEESAPADTGTRTRQAQENDLSGEDQPSDPAEAVLPQMEDLADLVDSLPTMLGDAGSDIGSNSWVVSGDHTESGKPLLANDPHLGPAMPSVWYQMGLHCSTVSKDCPFDVSGFTFSGLPGVIIGHNQDIGWGFTNLGPDVADLFIEKIDESDGTYLYDGKQKELATRKETIRVAGGDDVRITVRETDHGPLMSDVTGNIADAAQQVGDEDGPGEGEQYGLSLQWTALTPGKTPRAIFAMNSATDWKSFRHAAKLFDVPSQNLVYADTEGNIGYQAPGRIPIRKKGDGTLPQPGWTSSTGWKGYLSFDSLPSTYNPSSGYIVTANNAAVGPDYPHMITKDWDDGYRAERITSLISDQIDDGDPFTRDDMSRIQSDTFDAMAETLVPYLLDVDTNSAAMQGRNLLRDWDYHDDADSAAAAYFNIVWKNLLDEVFASKLPDSAPPQGSSRWFTVVSELLEEPNSSWWEDSEVDTRDEALSRAMDAAWSEAVDRMGDDTDSWSWGSLHTLTVQNQSLGESGIAPVEWLFNRGPYELSGSSSVVDATGWSASAGYEVNWVPSMRQVLDLSNFDDSTWVNLTGASGHAFSPHYDDQAPLWAAQKTLPWAFSEDARQSESENRLVLTPDS